MTWLLATRAGGSAIGDEAVAGAPDWAPVRTNDRAEEATLARIERLYFEQAERYARTAALITGDRAAAEDAVQDAFARAIVHRKKFREAGSLEAWLWRIVVNTALNGRRKRTADERATDRLGRSSPASGTDREIDYEARAELMRLPKRQRAAVFLRYYADLDYREIAQILAVTPGGVAKLLHDAHRTLAATLKRGGS